MDRAIPRRRDSGIVPSEATSTNLYQRLVENLKSMEILLQWRELSYNVNLIFIANRDAITLYSF